MLKIQKLVKFNKNVGIGANVKLPLRDEIDKIVRGTNEIALELG